MSGTASVTRERRIGPSTSLAWRDEAELIAAGERGGIREEHAESENWAAISPVACRRRGHRSRSSSHVHRSHRNTRPSERSIARDVGLPALRTSGCCTSRPEQYFRAPVSSNVNCSLHSLAGHRAGAKEAPPWGARCSKNAETHPRLPKPS